MADKGPYGFRALADTQSIACAHSVGDRSSAIIPDLSGQGEDSGEYGNAGQEAGALSLYLKKKGYTELALLMGASIGGQVGMYLLERCMREENKNV